MSKTDPGPIEPLLELVFDAVGDIERQAIAAIYGHIKKQRRKIAAQARTITTLQAKLERINEKRS